MGVGDWFLARSVAFKLLIDKFKEHKTATKSSFSKVKARHNAYEYILEGHEARLREVEKILNAVNNNDINIIKKKR